MSQPPRPSAPVTTCLLYTSGDQSALAVDMDGAALQDEVQAGGAGVGVGTIGIDALQVADLLSHGVVIGPGEVQAVHQAAPGVEAVSYTHLDVYKRQQEYGVEEPALNLDANAFFTKLSELQQTLIAADSLS